MLVEVLPTHLDVLDELLLAIADLVTVLLE